MAKVVANRLVARIVQCGNRLTDADAPVAEAAAPRSVAAAADDAATAAATASARRRGHTSQLVRVAFVDRSLASSREVAAE
jgi:hypothetical protein